MSNIVSEPLFSTTLLMHEWPAKKKQRANIKSPFEVLLLLYFDSSFFELRLNVSAGTLIAVQASAEGDGGTRRPSGHVTL